VSVNAIVMTGRLIQSLKTRRVPAFLDRSSDYYHPSTLGYSYETTRSAVYSEIV
jgi:hypothetical protein